MPETPPPPPCCRVLRHRSTIPERSPRLDTTLVDELVVRMKDPGATDGPRLSTLLRRLLLPLEFVGVLPFGSTARPDGTDESPFGALWAAYQHYGNPTASLIDVTVEASPATGSRLPRVPAPGPRKEAEQEMRVHGGSIR